MNTCTACLFVKSGFRTDEHDQLPTFHFGFLDDHTIFPQDIGYFSKRVKSDGLRIHNFTSPETHRHLDLVFLFQKFLNFPDLEIEIMFLGLRPELDLSGLNDGLLLFGFLLLFL